MKVVRTRLLDGELDGSRVLLLEFDDGGTATTTLAHMRKLGNLDCVEQEVLRQTRNQNLGMARELGEEVPSEYEVERVETDVGDKYFPKECNDNLIIKG